MSKYKEERKKCVKKSINICKNFCSKQLLNISMITHFSINLTINFKSFLLWVTFRAFNCIHINLFRPRSLFQINDRHLHLWSVFITFLVVKSKLKPEFVRFRSIDDSIDIGQGICQLKMQLTMWPHNFYCLSLMFWFEKKK